MTLSTPRLAIVLVVVLAAGFAAGLLAQSVLSESKATETTFAAGEDARTESITSDFKAASVPDLAAKKAPAGEPATTAAAATTAATAATATSAPAAPVAPATSTSDEPTFTTGN